MADENDNLDNDLGEDDVNEDMQNLIDGGFDMDDEIESDPAPTGDDELDNPDEDPDLDPDLNDNDDPDPENPDEDPDPENKETPDEDKNKTDPKPEPKKDEVSPEVRAILEENEKRRRVEEERLAREEAERLAREEAEKPDFFRDSLKEKELNIDEHYIPMLKESHARFEALRGAFHEQNQRLQQLETFVRENMGRMSATMQQRFDQVQYGDKAKSAMDEAIDYANTLDPDLPMDVKAKIAQRKYRELLEAAPAGDNNQAENTADDKKKETVRKPKGTKPVTTTRKADPQPTSVEDGMQKLIDQGFVDD